MARHRYLVSYDICDPRRLRRVAKVMEGFGSRLQYSVFECPLDNMRLEQCKAALAVEINAEYDQVLFVSLGPELADATLTIDALGIPYFIRSRVTII